MTAIDILARLKAATGPDRELDCLIFCATAQSPFTSYYPDCVLASLGGFAARLEIDAIDQFTASIDASLALVKRMLPGWSWRVASCCVSDDAWVIPDFNDPVHGQRLLAEWPLECQRDPLEYLKTDIDRRPAGNPALALLEALFTALAVKEAGST